MYFDSWFPRFESSLAGSIVSGPMVEECGRECGLPRTDVSRSLTQFKVLVRNNVLG
jgi:hypothetical protein